MNQPLKLPLNEPSPIESDRPTGAQFRQLLINGTAGFKAKFPDECPDNPEEAVDDFLMKGRHLAEAGRGSVKLEPDEFDWSNSGAIVVREQRELAIYINPFNQLVIRSYCYPDQDAAIAFELAHLPKIVARLQELAAEIERERS